MSENERLRLANSTQRKTIESLQADYNRLRTDYDESYAELTDEIERLRTLLDAEMDSNHRLAAEELRLRAELEGAIEREKFLRKKLGGDYARDMPDDIWRDIYTREATKDD